MLRRVLGAFVCLLMTGIASAQEFRSTLTGQVLDPQSAAIVGAKITVTSLETGAKSETTSGANGQYTIPFLTPGPYRIEAELTGFKRFVQERIQISTNQRVTEDIVLQVGSQTESVTITAEAPMLTTATASSGQVINSNQVENMPLNGRTPLVLAQLAFGVIPNADPRFNRPFDNSGPSGFSMGGAPAQSNELLLDGSPDMTRNRRVAFNPPVDAVSEVKVETFQADAAYGNTGGGTVNVVMRGGTNQFHGSLSEFNQVSALAATPYFTKRAGLKKPVTRYNQYGGTAGGPVIIPKLYDGRNKLFWFFAYEGIKDSFPEPITTTVPTAAERNGDFSALLRVGSNYQLYDPLTGVVEGTRIRRDPFPNNIIPANRLSPVAKAFLQYYPLPNQPGRADGQDNYLANSVRKDDFVSYLGRLDFNISDRHKFFVNARHNDRLEDRGNRFDNIATGNLLSRTNWGTTFDDVYTFTPTLLWNTRLSYSRFIEANAKPSIGFDITSLGFPAALAASSARLVLPNVQPSGYNALGDNGGDVTPFDTYQIFSTVTKITGRHSLKFGTDLRMQRESSISFGNSAGSYTFNSSYVQGPLDSAAAQPLGGGLASFLLGLPTGGNYEIRTARTNQAGYLAFFAQDDWRVSPTLTINAGLRYEHETPTRERYDRAVNGFDFTSPNALTAPAKAAYALNPLPELPVSAFNPVGGVTFAGSGKRDLYGTASNAFSPRFGISWSPAALRNRTVIRSGFGIFYFTYGTFGVQQPGFNASIPIVSTLNGGLTANSTLSNPFPAGITQPVGSSLGLNTFLGQNVTFVNPNLKQPYSVRWNFSVQQQLQKDTVLEVGYMGNHAVHLQEDRNINFIPAQYLSRSPIRDQTVIDRLSANVPNPFQGLPQTPQNGSRTTVGQLLRPYPQFNGDNGVQVLSQNNGSSYFHLLQVRLEKRFSAGLQLLANYAYSKLIDQTYRLNLSDPGLEKRISGDDRPQRIVLSANYELPLGRGKVLFAQAPKAVDLIVGGWVVNSIYTAQSGAPLAFFNSDRTINPLYYGGSLNLNAHPSDVGTLAFDTSRFNTNSREQLAFNIRTFPSQFSDLRADKVNNIDFSAIKNFRFTERLVLQYRFEMFNALNRAQFNAPELNPTNTNFGRITSQSNLPRSIQMGLRLRF